MDRIGRAGGRAFRGIREVASWLCLTLGPCKQPWHAWKSDPTRHMG